MTMRKAPERSGRTHLNQQFALVEAHISRSNHAASGSATAGMRSNRVDCSSDFCSKKLCTNSGCPTGTPRIFTTCRPAGRDASPLQTTASGFTLRAALAGPPPLLPSAERPAEGPMEASEVEKIGRTSCSHVTVVEDQWKRHVSWPRHCGCVQSKLNRRCSRK